MDGPAPPSDHARREVHHLVSRVRLPRQEGDRTQLQTRVRRYDIDGAAIGGVVVVGVTIEAQIFVHSELTRRCLTPLLPLFLHFALSLTVTFTVTSVIPSVSSSEEKVSSASRMRSLSISSAG